MWDGDRGVVLNIDIKSTVACMVGAVVLVYIVLGTSDWRRSGGTWMEHDTLFPGWCKQSQGGAVLLRATNNTIRLVALRNITFSSCDYTTGWIMTNGPIQIIEVETGQVVDTRRMFRFWPTGYGVIVSGELQDRIHGTRGVVYKWDSGGIVDIPLDIEAVSFLRWTNVVETISTDQLHWEKVSTNRGWL